MKELESHYYHAITHSIITANILMQRWANYSPQAKSASDLFGMEYFTFLNNCTTANRETNK